MKLNLAQIKDITLGTVRVEKEADGIHFYRFTAEQEELYKNRNEDFYLKTFATSGIQLRFKTNSERLFLNMSISLGTNSRRYFAFDIFVNGKKLGSLDNFSDTNLPQNYTDILLPLGEFSKSFDLEKGDKEVTLYFPWSVKAVLKELSLDDGAYIEPIKPKHKLLSFGDSITHGYDALYPSNKYITRLSRFLDAEEFNKAIGGEMFFPALAATKEDFVPDYITVAYGTNDWSHSTKKDFIDNCKGFFEALSATYPDSKIFAITPIWRKDFKEYSDVGEFEDIEKIIRSATEKFKNIVVISGFDFVPKDEDLYADLRLHPNDEGFRFYFENLAQQMEKYI